MADQYIGEIRIFAGTFAPLDWNFCDGSLLSIAEYQALFSLIGTTYGGDGSNNFALPDLRGRIPVGQGLGPGLSNRTLGEKRGAETAVLSSNQLPVHTHAVKVSTAAGNANSPANSYWSAGVIQYAAPPNDAHMNAAAISTTGKNPADSHANVMPSLCLNYIICVQNGYYPDRP